MDLLERFALGDMDAFEALFREHQAGVYRWTMRIVRDHAAAEDLTMEAFWRGYKSHASFDPMRKSHASAAADANSAAQSSGAFGPFGPWIRRIATNLAFDHLRHASHTVPLVDDDSRDSHAGVRASELVGSRTGAASHSATAWQHSGSDATAANPAIRRETRDQIESAFSALPPKLRIVARLSLVEDVSHAEIAQALDISEGAVRTRVHRAIKQLRKSLRRMGARP